MPATMHRPIARPRGVDLWFVPLAQPAARAARLVAACSARERERAARMPVAGRRREFLLGRGIVRSVLGAYLGVAPCEVEIAVGAGGKPFLVAAGAPAFNVSHSHGLTAIAVTGGFPVGVDLERIDPRLDVGAIARRFLAVDEAAHLARLDAAERATAFLRLWTRREACAKASGAGFTGGLGATLAPTAETAHDGPRTVVDLHPAAGYVGALAYSASPAPVHTPDHALACLETERPSL